MFQKDYLDTGGHRRGRRERIIKSTLLQKRQGYVIPTQMFVNFPWHKNSDVILHSSTAVIMNIKFLNHWQLKEIKNITQKSPLPRVPHLCKREEGPSGVIYIRNINKTEVIFPCTTGKVVVFPLRALSNESHDFKWLCIKTQEGWVTFY